MIVGSSSRIGPLESTISKFPTPPGTTWNDIQIEIVSNDSLRVRVRGKTKRFAAIDIGFRDGRKRDLLNRQWDTLSDFARGSGVLSWSTCQKRPNLEEDDIGKVALGWNNHPATHGTGKRVQNLRGILRAFFDLQDDPFHQYSSRTGWVSKFKISDLSYGSP